MNYSIFIDYLTHDINSNIEWGNIINKYILYLDNIKNPSDNDKVMIEKFIKYINRLGWIDKTDPIEDTSRDYYNELYTKILMSNEYKNIGILYRDIKEDEIDIYNMRERLNILKSICEMKNIKYIVSDNVAECNKKDSIIILSQFKFTREELDKIDKHKIWLPTDDYYNIIYKKDNNVEITYDFIHTIKRYVKTDIIKLIHNNYIYLYE